MARGKKNLVHISTRADHGIAPRQSAPLDLSRTRTSRPTSDIPYLAMARYRNPLLLPFNKIFYAFIDLST